MSIIDTLITDRTEADVNLWESLKSKGWEEMTPAERSQWLAGMKGAYNATDLNRVGEACEYLAAHFRRYGYNVSVSLPKIEEGRYIWKMEDVPTPEQMLEYLEMVRVIRSVLDMYVTTPEVPADMDELTIEEANNIEKILVDVEDLIVHLVRAFKRSNAYMFISGNNPLPSFESYLGRTWEELDEMNTTWRNWQAANWYQLLYGNLEAEGDVA